jgi:hypothetical protein
MTLTLPPPPLPPQWPTANPVSLPLTPPPQGGGPPLATSSRSPQLDALRALEGGAWARAALAQVGGAGGGVLACSRPAAGEGRKGGE